MVSQPALEQPDPQSLIHAISRNICHDGLKILPTTLQQFAHLQLLAARVRSEASRAMTIHLELSDRLESEGVDEYDWCNLGALSQAEGRALRRIIDEGEGRGEEKREDVMMELSMNVRLFHLALILRKGDPNGPVMSLLQTYFPDLAPPPPPSPKGSKQLQKWYADIRSSRMCFIRAMTPDQAQRMAVKRKTAQAMLDMVRKALAQGRPRPTWAQLLPEETLSAEKVLERYRRDMVQTAETVLRDKVVIDTIFSETADEEDGMDTEPSRDRLTALGNTIEPARSTHDDAFGLSETRLVTDNPQVQIIPNLASTSSAPLVNRSTISSASSRRAEKREDSVARMDRGSSAHRLHSPQYSSTSGNRSSPILPSASTHPTVDASQSHKSSPQTSAIHRPRRSRLPPPEGPDYTSPLPHSHYSPKDLRPFSNDRLVRAGHSPNERKRPRTSEGHDVGAGQDELTKRTKGDSRLAQAD
ncbi:hypothetical protein DB88DRAFT_478188 [Papiliotrema laurentii]|uniref:Uncharacterized protein n=1 Tax=Papiliotrema laurentii TaxID=5418 RepID=A0AAD9L8Z5_PAPLA|nr:hypothetical protein DB88DRAFT_478188 [Papiliotrema laurentii]